MEPTIPIFAKCPECGKEKRLTTNRPYTTQGLKRYSDGYEYFPDCPAISNIQVCRECLTPYFLFQVKIREAETLEEINDDEIATGRIPYEEEKELALMEIPDTKDPQKEYLFRTRLLHSYNHAFRGLSADAFADLEVEDNMTRTEEDLRIHRDNLSGIIELLEKSQHPKTDETTLFLSELYRELGNFDKTIELLKDFMSPNRLIMRDAKQILQKAKEKDSAVFEIDRTGEKIMVVM